MNRLFAAALLAATLPFSATADVRSDAKDAFMMWQPTNITFSGGRLTVILPQQRITEDIYTSVLTAGLCMWTAAGIDFSSVAELVVLNRFEKQGYVNERGARDCDVLNTLPVGSKEMDLKILSATHLY